MATPARGPIPALVLVLVLGLVGWLSSHGRIVAGPPREVDPTGWGGDHVGRPVPEFVSGDECLFCHRNDVGPSWGDNRHSRTVRAVDPGAPERVALSQAPGLGPLAEAVTLVMGHDRRRRFLKPSEAFGKLDLLSVAWVPPRDGAEGRLIETDRPHWEPDTFADSCAGCHATGVDPRQRTFTARSLDCCVCHGDVPGDHTKNAALVFLSPRRNDPPRVVTSICAQCHVRNGRSRSTGRPYPNNFVAGDNLFRDFQADLSEEAIRRAGAADAHVLENVRDVAFLGREEVTCLSCHDVHSQSTRKHHRVPQGALCLHCHGATGPKAIRKPYDVHSRTCAY